MKTNIAIFASGGGSNAEAIISHFSDSEKGKIALVVTNNSKAGVISRAENHKIPYYIHSKEDLSNGNLLARLKEYNIQFVVLAGYLKKVSDSIIDAFPNKIVNIHPALLPNYGGHGMYGMNVHRAIFEAGEKESGITIHYINENYDEGNIIVRYYCSIVDCKSPEEIQKKVLTLEHKYFARCIESLLDLKKN